MFIAHGSLVILYHRHHHSLTHSFLICGISACVDDIEDASIHCLKSGGVAKEALPTITENTATLLFEAQRQDDDDRDSFADLDEEEEELEINELSVEDLSTIPVIPDCSLIT